MAFDTGHAKRLGWDAEVGALYGDYRLWLVARLTKRIGCAESAADLAQTTFLRLLGARAAEIRNPKAFLATVAHGLMVDHIRRRDLERAWIAAMAATMETATPSSEDRLSIVDALVQIDLMLDGLGARVKKALLLSRLDGLTYRQIAMELHVSLSTVEKDMATAIRHCRTFQFGD